MAGKGKCGMPASNPNLLSSDSYNPKTSIGRTLKNRAHEFYFSLARFFIFKSTKNINCAHKKLSS